MFRDVVIGLVSVSVHYTNLVKTWRESFAIGP
jgi:hypothetical protein